MHPLRRSLLVALLPISLALAVGLLLSRPLAAQSTGPAFVWQAGVPGTTSAKFPHLATSGATVHTTVNINRADAAYWSKLDTATDYGSPISLGPAQDQPDYSTTSITTGPDGTLYAVWVNQPERTIYLRIKRPSQDWEPARVVAQSQPFPVFPEVAVTSNGAITTVWRNPDKPFVYRRSQDDGVTWGAQADLSVEAGVNTAALSVGANGALAAAYTGGEGDKLQIYVAQWNGSSFARTRLTALNGDYADPSLAYAPDGTLLVTWRGVAESGNASGVFVAERQPSGAFSVARLVGGAVAGRVSVVTDAQQNAHVLWTGAGGGDYQLWYSVRPHAGAWSTPVAAPNMGGSIFNAFAAVSTGTDSAISANAVSEVFIGSQVTMRAYRFRSGLTGSTTPPPPTVSARPVIEGGAATTRAMTLTVTFADVSGTPAEVRHQWGSAPTDASPWLPYTGALTVTAPPLLTDRCQEATLFTQVRDAAGVLQSQALSDSIAEDHGIQATVRDQPLAAAGYTNQPQVTLAVDGTADCSGLITAHLAGSADASITVRESRTTLTAPIPDVEGPATVGVELTDALGNSGTMSVTVVYDKTPPEAIYGVPLTVNTDARSTVVQTLGLQGTLYRDGGTTPWGLALAVSRQEPTTATTPTWTAILPLNAQRTTITPEQQGLVRVDTRLTLMLPDLLPPAEITPGTYYYTVALVDPAGNPASAHTTGRITITKVIYPPVALPLIRR